MPSADGRVNVILWLRTPHQKRKAGLFESLEVGFVPTRSDGVDVSVFLVAVDVRRHQ